MDALLTRISWIFIPPTLFYMMVLPLGTTYTLLPAQVYLQPKISVRVSPAITFARLSHRPVCPIEQMLFTDDEGALVVESTWFHIHAQIRLRSQPISRPLESAFDSMTGAKPRIALAVRSRERATNWISWTNDTRRTRDWYFGKICSQIVSMPCSSALSSSCFFVK